MNAGRLFPLVAFGSRCLFVLPGAKKKQKKIIVTAGKMGLWIFSKNLELIDRNSLFCRFVDIGLSIFN